MYEREIGKLNIILPSHVRNRNWQIEYYPAYLTFIVMVGFELFGVGHSHLATLRYGPDWAIR